LHLFSCIALSPPHFSPLSLHDALPISRRRSARGRPVARRNRHHAGANSSISAWGEGNDSLSANPKLLWAVSDVGLFPRRGSVYRMADGGPLTECLPH